jgi:hypothetical protein
MCRHPPEPLDAAEGAAALGDQPGATDPQGAAMPPTDDRRQAVALFRYSLIREAADPALGAHERGALVRALAEGDHLGPQVSGCA